MPKLAKIKDIALQLQHLSEDIRREAVGPGRRWDQHGTMMRAAGALFAEAVDLGALHAPQDAVLRGLLAVIPRSTDGWQWAFLSEAVNEIAPQSTSNEQNEPAFAAKAVGDFLLDVVSRRKGVRPSSTNSDDAKAIAKEKNRPVAEVQAPARENARWQGVFPNGPDGWLAQMDAVTKAKHQTASEIADAVISKLPGKKPDPGQPTSSSGYTTARLCELLSLEDGGTVSNYAKLAGVTRPKQGGSHYRYPPSDTKKMCIKILELSTEKTVRNAATALLATLDKPV